MNYEIRERSAFRVMGLQFRVNPMTADYHDLWANRYSPRQPEIAPSSTDQAHYGVYFCSDEPEMVDLVVGMAVRDVDAVPEGMVLREVPAGREAVFTCTMPELSATWRDIYGGWFESSGFERDDSGPDIERYSADFDPATGHVTIHVPVRERRG